MQKALEPSRKQGTPRTGGSRGGGLVPEGGVRKAASEDRGVDCLVALTLRHHHLLLQPSPPPGLAAAIPIQGTQHTEGCRACALSLSRPLTNRRRGAPHYTYQHHETL
jgi:hypothetical protein